MNTRKLIANVFFSALTVITLSSAPALAEQRVLAGKHSRDEIKTACSNVGGIDVQGGGGKGYGCVNPSKGTMVACADNGVCTGYTPD